MASNLYVPMQGDLLVLPCQRRECENDAAWWCYPQGYLTTSIALCDECKAEAERQEAARERQVTQ